MARALTISAAALIGAAAFLILVNRIYPIRDWLFWIVARVWGLQFLLLAALVAGGNCLLERVFHLPADRSLERLTLSATVGAVCFALGMFAAGLAGWLRPAWAVVWPATMLVGGVLGAPDSLRTLVVSRFRLSQPDSLPARATLAFGTLCLGIVYLGVFTPDAVNYDAAWTHLSIAQDYAREGRIVRFEADWPKNLAHLGSLISTWSFLLPGLGPPPVRWMMALHTEFVFFVLTLVGVAAGVARVAERPVRGAWAVMFLFPGIFVYDSNLGAAADHFAAFFVPPTFLVAAHAARTMDRRWWALFGVVAGAAVITKYQTFYVLVPLACWLVVASVQRSITGFAKMSRASALRRAIPPSEQRPRVSRRARLLGDALAGPLTAAVTAVLVTAPHFVRNFVFYRNPVYPFGQRLFTGSTPHIPDAASMADNIISHFGSHPPSQWAQRLGEAVQLMFTFSFHPYAGRAGHPPVFGTLATLCLPFALLLPRARRIRLVVVLGLGAVFLWGWTYRTDRNLQVITPLLAIATGAILARAWETGRVARVAVGILVGVQLVWSGDHLFLGSDRINSTLALIRSGFDGRAGTRFDGYAGDRIAIGRALPPQAKVLLHNLHLNLGIDRPVLMDQLGMQGLIDPRTYRSPRDLYDRYRAAGITHVVFQPGWFPTGTKVDEVLFAAFTDRYAAATLSFGAMRVLPLPEAGPPEEAPYAVLMMGVAGYADGVYDVTQLGTAETMPADLQRHSPPRTAASLDQASIHLGAVNAVVLGESSRPLRDQPALTGRFHLVTEYPAKFSVWIHQQERQLP